MAGLEHIEVTPLAQRGRHLYRVLSSEGRIPYEQVSQAILDAHLFTAADLLELAAYVEEHRAQLEQEASEDEARMGEEQA